MVKIIIVEFGKILGLLIILLIWLNCFQSSLREIQFRWQIEHFIVHFISFAMSMLLIAFFVNIFVAKKWLSGPARWLAAGLFIFVGMIVILDIGIVHVRWDSRSSKWEKEHDPIFFQDELQCGFNRYFPKLPEPYKVIYMKKPYIWGCPYYIIAKERSSSGRMMEIKFDKAGIIDDPILEWLIPDDFVDYAELVEPIPDRTIQDTMEQFLSWQYPDHLFLVREGLAGDTAGQMETQEVSRFYVNPWVQEIHDYGLDRMLRISMQQYGRFIKYFFTHSPGYRTDMEHDPYFKILNNESVTLWELEKLPNERKKFIENKLKPTDTQKSKDKEKAFPGGIPPYNGPINVL
jgi:hypothetical protein